VPLAVKAIAVVGQVTVRPGGVEEAVRETDPTKLNVLVSVTVVDAPEVPELKLTGLLALIVKSPT
jgi:hypothetical protein